MKNEIKLPENGSWRIEEDHEKYKIILAAITYPRGFHGDQKSGNSLIIWNKERYWYANSTLHKEYTTEQILRNIMLEEVSNPKFKKGDYVKVIDRGYFYSTYTNAYVTAWGHDHNHKIDNLKNSLKGTVVTTMRHHIYDSFTPVAVELDDGKRIIIGEKGLAHEEKQVQSFALKYSDEVTEHFFDAIIEYIKTYSKLVSYDGWPDNTFDDFKRESWIWRTQSIGRVDNHSPGLTIKSIQEVKNIIGYVEPKEETKMVEFEKGCWYRHNRETKFVFCYQGNRTSHWGWDCDGVWDLGVNKNNNLHNYAKNYTKLSNSEIEELLIKEAKRRGLVKGIRITSPWLDGPSQGSLTEYHFQSIGNNLCMLSDDFGTHTIFKDGEWAEVYKPIVDTVMLEEGDVIEWCTTPGHMYKVISIMGDKFECVNIDGAHFIRSLSLLTDNIIQIVEKPKGQQSQPINETKQTNNRNEQICKVQNKNLKITVGQRKRGATVCGRRRSGPITVRSESYQARVHRG